MTTAAASSSLSLKGEMRHFVVFAAGTLVLGACENAAAPNLSRSSDVSLDASVSGDETTVTILTDAHDLKFTGAIGSYPSATIVEIRMQGSSITGYYYSSDGQGPFWTDIGLAGVNVGGACHGGVAVHFSASASYRYGPPYEGCPAVGAGSGSSSWSTIRKISGSGSVLRSDVFSDSCGGPCRKYEGGSQTVTVERMPAELKVMPS